MTFNPWVHWYWRLGMQSNCSHHCRHPLGWGKQNKNKARATSSKRSSALVFEYGRDCFDSKRKLIKKKNIDAGEKSSKFGSCSCKKSIFLKLFGGWWGGRPQPLKPTLGQPMGAAHGSILGPKRAECSPNVFMCCFMFHFDLLYFFPLVFGPGLGPGPWAAPVGPLTYVSLGVRYV